MAPPQDVPPQYEMCNLTTDAIEQFNLTSPAFETPESREVRPQLQATRKEVPHANRVTPSRDWKYAGDGYAELCSSPVDGS